MKSECYRQVSAVSFQPRTIPPTHKPKRMHASSRSNSRPFQSQQRTLKHSVDPVVRNNRPQAVACTPLAAHSQPVSTPLAQSNQPSQVGGCGQCQKVRVEQQRRTRAFKLQYEQDLTKQTERFIAMQKKYLVKENQNIKLLAQIERLKGLIGSNQEREKTQARDLSQLKENYNSLQEEMSRLHSQVKEQRQKTSIMDHFLGLYLQQTRTVINWGSMVQNYQEELPPLIRLLKEDILVRKHDLEIHLKDASEFKKSTEQEPPSDRLTDSFFEGRTEEGESFMKYLKHDTMPVNKGNSLHFPISHIKNKSCWVEPFSLKESQPNSVNKENQDSANRVSFMTLLQSRITESKTTKKGGEQEESLMRLLLMQAQTIETNKQALSSLKSSSIEEGIGEAQECISILSI